MNFYFFSSFLIITLLIVKTHGSKDNSILQEPQPRSSNLAPSLKLKAGDEKRARFLGDTFAVGFAKFSGAYDPYYHHHHHGHYGHHGAFGGGYKLLGGYGSGGYDLHYHRPYHHHHHHGGGLGFGGFGGGYYGNGGGFGFHKQHYHHGFNHGFGGHYHHHPVGHFPNYSFH